MVEVRSDARMSDTRMSDTEALLWALEHDDPALRSTITVVIALDAAPGLDDLRAHMDRLSRQLPRFRHRVAGGPLAGLAPRWEDDPDFDVEFHVRALAAPGDDPVALLRAVEPLAAEGLDHSRPLWSMHLAEHAPGGGAALAVRLHHTFTDGLGAVELAARLFTFDDARAPAAPMPPLPPPTGTPPAGRLVAELLREAGRTARVVSPLARATRAVASGGDRADQLGRLAVAAARDLVGQAAPAPAPLSPVLTGRSLRGHFAELAYHLGAIKGAGRRHGGTVNDVFVAGLLAGLRRYHERHGVVPDAVRVGIPVATGGPGGGATLRNQWAPVRILGPLAETDTGARIAEVHRLVAERRAGPAIGLTELTAAALNRLPPARAVVAGTLRGIDVTASNVPGVDAPMWLLGQRIRSMTAFGPRSGAAVNATMLGYDGCLRIGVTVDPAAAPDVGVLVESLRDGLDETIGEGHPTRPDLG